jgi:hypothetical protein
VNASNPRIANEVFVGLVELTDDFGFYDIINGTLVDMGIEGELNRIDNVLPEFLKRHACSELPDRFQGVLL